MQRTAGPPRAGAPPHSTTGAVLAVAVAGVLVGLALPSASLEAQDACAPGADSLITTGWQSLRAGSAGLAGAQFSRGAELCPSHSGSYTGLGYVSLRRGDPGGALRWFELALVRDPGRVDARDGLARALARTGDLGGAEREWTALRDTDPDHAEAAIGLARIRRWRGNPERARELLSDPGLASHPEAVSERRALDRQLRPVALARRIHERGSDGNRVDTWIGSASVVVEGTRVGWTGIRRSLGGQGPGPSATSTSHELTTTWTLGDGWGVDLGLGAFSSGPPAGTLDGARVRGRAMFWTPGWKRLQGRAWFEEAPVDHSVAQVARGVWSRGAGAELRAGLGSPWTGRLSGQLSRIQGLRRNLRWDGSAEIERVVGARTAVLTRLRGFGFERDVDDGYYDPRVHTWLELVLASREDPASRATLGFELRGGVQATDRAPPTSLLGATVTGVLRTHRHLDVVVRGGASTSADRASTDVGRGYRYGFADVTVRVTF